MPTYVITGGPCSGKTTLLNELRDGGYQVLEEVARHILEERGKPKSKEEFIEFQLEICKRQKILEENLDKNSTYFLDRGYNDVPAYSKHKLGKVPEVVRKIRSSLRYDKVFVLDLLPFVDDGIRIEKDENEAKQIHNFIKSTYEEDNYKTINIHLLPIKERADFLLRCLKNGN